MTMKKDLSIASFIAWIWILAISVERAAACFPQVTCRCLSQTRFRETAWLPATTLLYERGDYFSCRGQGRCELRACIPTVFHSCPRCGVRTKLTREIDGTGYIHFWDAWDLFVPADPSDASCLQDVQGTLNFDGSEIYGTIIIPSGTSVEIFSPFIGNWSTDSPQGEADFIRVQCNMN